MSFPTPWNDSRDDSYVAQRQGAGGGQPEDEAVDAGPAGEEHEGEGDGHGDTEAQPDHVWGEWSVVIGSLGEPAPRSVEILGSGHLEIPVCPGLVFIEKLQNDDLLMTSFVALRRPNDDHLKDDDQFHN